MSNHKNLMTSSDNGIAITGLNQSLPQEIEELRRRVVESRIPDDFKIKISRELAVLQRTVNAGNYDQKYDQIARYIDWILQVPWNKESNDNLNISHAKQVFEAHHYGMQEVKDRFIEFIAMMNLKAKQASEVRSASPVILLVGLVGTGKTTFATSLAEALGRKLVRIPFGGMSQSLELRGSSRLLNGASPGRVVKGLCEAKVMNPIFLLDEIDRVAEATRMDIMGVLVELLDPAQNSKFVDAYLDYPLDLSQAIFLSTANNTTNIPTAVLDRMEKISMPSYSDEEKLVIAKRYILPKLFERSGLRENQIFIEEELWPKIIRPLGYDMGIRSLERTLDGLVRKATRIIVERGFNEIYVTKDNLKLFIPQY